MDIKYFLKGSAAVVLSAAVCMGALTGCHSKKADEATTENAETTVADIAPETTLPAIQENTTAAEPYIADPLENLHRIPGQVVESPRVDKSYFDDVAFVGDSISNYLGYYATANGALGNAQFLTSGSLSATNALWEISDKSVHPRYNGVKMKLEKSIPLTKANKVYIMLGMNDISYGLDYAFEHYKTLLNNIHKAAPDAMLYIESVTPRVYQGSNMSNPYLNNTNITKYNKMLSSYCRTKGWFFVNVAEVMFDGNGYLKRSYCGDPDGMGMHYLWAGCEAWVDYLYTHTAE